MYVQIEYLSQSLCNREEKQRVLNNNFIERKDFIRCYQRNGWMDLNTLWAINFLHNDGTNSYFSNRWFRLKNDGLLGMGARTSAIKFVLAGTLKWWQKFPRLLVCRCI